MRHVFIGICWNKPAVITESLYQLHHDPNEIPDEVIVITTAEGETHIREELFETGRWHQFKDDLNIAADKLQFGVSDKYIRLLPDRQGGDSTDALNNIDWGKTADYILNVLRQFTEDSDNRITFSITDGHEIISATCALCMSLLGRRQDVLCHRLVNSPFNKSGIEPPFYYPDSRNYYLPDGTTVNGNDAVINLCEIPFARCRYLFNDRLNQLPGSFLDSIDQINGKIAENLDAPELFMKPETVQCFIGDIEIKFNAAEFTLYWLLVLRCKNSCPPLYGQEQLDSEFYAFVDTINSMVMPGIIHHDFPINSDDIHQLIAVIVVRIKEAVAIEQGRNLCLPIRDRGVYGLLLPPDNIICPRNY
ncbi:MAG: CRISPR-associated ring nuclease Csm6 [Victivallaceae bacterium]|nr:CRISPR-associated ring nuclease Csm6 [Victivallaceae bacterium]